jgi:ferredoxin
MTIMHSIYREPGKVRIDRSACTQCGECVRICPAEVLILDDRNVRVRSDTAFGCVACGHCMMVCPEEAITVTGRGISPDDLLPLPTRQNRAGADALAALMQSRRSVRRFSDQHVDAELLDRILEMASTAPMGIPPWDIGCITIRRPEQVQQIAAEVIKGYEGFLKFFRPWVLASMRFFVRRATYEMFRYFIRPLAEAYTASYHAGRDVLFWNAPALMIFHHSPYAEATDATIACTYAMLAAESLGLGSTIIGGATPVIQRNKALCRKLGIPAGNTPSIALILGHPATNFRHSIRRRFAGLS